MKESKNYSKVYFKNKKDTLKQDRIPAQTILVFFSFSVLFAILWYWKFHNLPLMQPDSGSYIGFSAVRTVGYPYFLWLVNSIFGTLSVIPVIQMIMLTSAATCLAAGFYNLTKRYTLTFCLLAGLMVNPVYHHAFNIMTEAVSISLLMAFISITILLFQNPSLKALRSLSLVAGLAILVRPVHYAYIPVLLVIGVGARFPLSVRLVQRITATFGPLCFLILIGCWGQYTKNGVFRLESMGGFNMIGKVALIADKDIVSRHPQFLREVAQFASPIQHYLDQTPDLHIRYLLSAPYYDYFRYHYLGKISKDIYHDDRVYKETGWDIVKARPYAYIKDAWMNYCALWQLYDLLTSGEKKELKNFLDSHQPPPYMSYPWYPNAIDSSLKHNPVFVWGIRSLLSGICISGLIMMFMAFIHFFRRQPLSPLVLTGAAAAALTQSHFLLTALSQAGLPRYSFALWPAIVLVGIVMLELGRQKWNGYSGC